MDIEQIEQALNILSMVIGDCPYERGIGKKESECPEPSCLDCWREALSKKLKNVEGKNDTTK